MGRCHILLLVQDRSARKVRPILWYRLLGDFLVTVSCRSQMDAEREAIAQRPKTSPGVAVKSRNMCYIIFTSGSTGRPKGTVLQHAGVVNYFLSLVE